MKTIATYFILSLVGLSTVACTSTSESLPQNSEALDAGLESPVVVRPQKGTGLLSTSTFGEYFFNAEQVGDLHERVSHAHEKLLKEPGNLAELKVLAYDALSRTNPDGALMYLGVARDSGNAWDDEAYVIAGVAFLTQGKETEGFESLRRAEAQNGRNVLPAMNMGLYFLNHGAGVEAQKQFARAISIEPLNPTFVLQAAAACYVARKFTDSVKYYEQALRLEPFNALAIYNLGIVQHVGLRNYALARVQFQKLLDDKGLSSDLRAQAQGALANVARDEDGRKGLATIGTF